MSTSSCSSIWFSFFMMTKHWISNFLLNFLTVGYQTGFETIFLVYFLSQQSNSCLVTCNFLLLIYLRLWHFLYCMFGFTYPLSHLPGVLFEVNSDERTISYTTFSFIFTDWPKDSQYLAVTTYFMFTLWPPKYKNKTQF